MKKKLWLMTLLSGAAITLAACGGEASPSPAAQEKTPAASAAQTSSASANGDTASREPASEEPASSVSVLQEAAKCMAVKLPTDSAIPAPTKDDWSQGSETASLTIIEYADFQCPGCAGMAPVLEQLKKDFGDEMRIVYRQFPLITIHDKAHLTAEAAEAAGAQGKFWEMKDLLFGKQGEWAQQTPEQMRQTLSGYAKELGLDVAKFDKELDDGTYKAKVDQEYDSASKSGLPGTPSFIINGVVFPADSLGLSYQALQAFTLLMKMKANHQFYEQAPTQVLEAGKGYEATLKTDKGDIVIKLYTDTAPLNANSVAFLAKNGYYDGVTFHRVLSGFVAQGGDPTGMGIGFPGYQCVDEITDKRKFDREGLVAMANSGANTNGSQFFITLGALPQLDGKYTIIGEVVSGMDVVKKLTPRDPSKDPSAPAGDKIISVSIAEK